MSTTTTVRTATQKGKQPDNSEGPSTRPPPGDPGEVGNPGNPNEPDPDPKGSESGEEDEEADFLHNVRQGNKEKKVNKIPDPEPFHGDQHKLGRFLLGLQLKIDGNNDGFPTKQSKIAYAASLLRGSAADWIEPYITERKNKRILTMR